MRSHLPFFETKRFLIREVMEKDLYDMYEYSKIREVGYNAGWEPHISLSYTKEVIKMFRKKYLYSELGIFAIVIKQTGKMIGTCELHNYTERLCCEKISRNNQASRRCGFGVITLLCASVSY